MKLKNGVQETSKQAAFGRRKERYPMNFILKLLKLLIPKSTINILPLRDFCIKNGFKLGNQNDKVDISCGATITCTSKDIIINISVHGNEIDIELIIVKSGFKFAIVDLLEYGNRKWSGSYYKFASDNKFGERISEMLSDLKQFGSFLFPIEVNKLDEFIIFKKNYDQKVDKDIQDYFDKQNKESNRA